MDSRKLSPIFTELAEFKKKNNRLGGETERLDLIRYRSLF